MSDAINAAGEAAKKAFEVRDEAHVGATSEPEPLRAESPDAEPSPAAAADPLDTATDETPATPESDPAAPPLTAAQKAWIRKIKAAGKELEFNENDPESMARLDRLVQFGAERHRKDAELIKRMEEAERKERAAEDRHKAIEALIAKYEAEGGQPPQVNDPLGLAPQQDDPRFKAYEQKLQTQEAALADIVNRQRHITIQSELATLNAQMELHLPKYPVFKHADFGEVAQEWLQKEVVNHIKLQDPRSPVPVPVDKIAAAINDRWSKYMTPVAPPKPVVSAVPKPVAVIGGKSASSNVHVGNKKPRNIEEAGEMARQAYGD